jgi:hypothetical protein
MWRAARRRWSSVGKAASQALEVHGRRELLGRIEGRGRQPSRLDLGVALAGMIPVLIEEAVEPVHDHLFLLPGGGADAAG